MNKTLRYFSTVILMLALLGLLVACGGAADEPAVTEAEPAAEPTTAEPEPQAESEVAEEPMEAADADELSGAVDGDSDDGSMDDSEVAMDSGDEPAASDSASGDVATVTIGAIDLMQYTVREFSVQAGQEVELTLEHQGQLPVQAMGHNVVILPADGNYTSFARQITRNGGSSDNDYLPESMRDGLVAFTRMIGGGDSDTIRFTAPSEPGEYPFLCTFPGHSGLMNGVMIVQ
ncbi:MAG: plastocyanin/azurin family copper-binding protein [Pseudomonadota bacterium]